MSSNSNEHHYGYSPVEGSGWLGGDIDNIRIWEEVLDGPAIRDAMLTREPSVDFGGTTVEPSFAITFDGDVTGDTVEKSQERPPVGS
ncbi:MAG: hypothetical protein H7A45_13560 [Verrucomicrobiales bacterium]|nr:hypothetical protein [Verrucomicrobiales bacterium]